MTKIDEDYAWYFSALDKAAAGLEIALDTELLQRPHSGFYRARGKDRRWYPVAYSDGGKLCWIDLKPVSSDKALHVWERCAAQPIAYKDYVFYQQNGRWENENAAVIGHNQAPDDDSPEAIAEQLDNLSREAERLIAAGAAKDQATADQASDLAQTFGEIEKKTKALHKAEKTPVLEASRAIDAKWSAFWEKAADLKSRLKAIVETPFLKRKAEEIRAAQQAAIAGGWPAEALAEQKVTAGASKRPTALRTYYKAVIEDRDALLAALKDHPEVVACLEKIANEAARKKIALAGCKVVAEQRAA